ncbi:MAG: hypothetical protein PHU71_05010 [Candidatus Gracilibacteria bacterium]|nr:hypothetical protein [Candidatus Gracilibacteria bacterium]
MSNTGVGAYLPQEDQTAIPSNDSLKGIHRICYPVTFLIAVMLGFSLPRGQVLTSEDAEIVISRLNDNRQQAAQVLRIDPETIKTGILVDENPETKELRKRIFFALDSNGDGHSDTLMASEYYLNTIVGLPAGVSRTFLHDSTWERE